MLLGKTFRRLIGGFAIPSAGAGWYCEKPRPS